LCAYRSSSAAMGVGIVLDTVLGSHATKAWERVEREEAAMSLIRDYMEGDVHGRFYFRADLITAVASAAAG
jgi:hypothetical protein